MNERAREVFLLNDNDFVYDVNVENGIVKVTMDEGDGVIFDYIPDMSDRPQALDYLLGLREVFND